MLNVQMKVAQIVLDHPECAAVFTRRRIDYCCKGELPLAEACTQKGEESAAVLAELEAAISARAGGCEASEDPRGLPTEHLLALIVKRHHQYLRGALPMLVPLAKKVARVHGAHNMNLLDVRDAVEELAELLLPHLDEEEQVLFPALVGETDPREAKVLADELKTMQQDHLEVGAVLEWLRKASHDFDLPEWACTSYTTLMRELETLEADVFKHVHLENHVLLPRFTAAASSAA